MRDVSIVQCLTYSHQLQSYFIKPSQSISISKAISHHGFITSTTSVHDLFKFFIGFPDQIFRVVHCLWGNIYQTPLCKLEIYARENGILIYSLFAVKQNLNQFCLKLRNVIVVYQISLFMVIIYYTGFEVATQYTHEKHIKLFCLLMIIFGRNCVGKKWCALFKGNFEGN